MQESYTVFYQGARLGSGPIVDMTLVAKKADASGQVLVFSDRTGQQIDLDLQGSQDDVIRKLREHPVLGKDARPKGRGRPNLGVVGREISLLPRHWDWLNQQPKSASATIRALIEGKMSSPEARTGAAYQVMSILAGDLPGFEEASRTLFAGDFEGFRVTIALWPEDIRDYVSRVLHPEAT